MLLTDSKKVPQSVFVYIEEAGDRYLLIFLLVASEKLTLFSEDRYLSEF